MREYLFRGKTKGYRDNRWVEGFLLKKPGISTTKYLIAIPNSGVAYEVDPETVGQYTGLTDKNGTKIFEGDALERYSPSREEWFVEGFVKYGYFNCSCCEGVYGWIIKDGDIRDVKQFRVAGNIHDNPELLGGETDG